MARGKLGTSIESLLMQRKSDTRPVKSRSGVTSIREKKVKTNIYSLEHGVLCTRESLVPRRISRRSVTIVLTASRAPFQLSVGGGSDFYHAAAIRPLTPHRLCADNVGAVSVIVSPSHPRYRAFRAIPQSGVLPLERALFAPLERDIGLAYRGGLDLQLGACLYDDIICTVAQLLPEPPALDSRIAYAIDLLDKNPFCSLYELATEIDLSPSRLSHLFADEMGIPLRSYQLSRRIRIAGELLDNGHTLAHTAGVAGFGDVEHLCLTWRTTYGAPPSYFYNNPQIRFISWWNPNRSVVFAEDKAIIDSPLSLVAGYR